MSEGGQGGLIPGGFSAQFQTDPQTGAAVASIPIEVPPGRGGLTPQVVLSYNSMNGSSWVGTGWDLTMGYIQRSTKKGVPPHAIQNDQFDYTDDDNFMLVSPGGGAEIVYDEDNTRYRAKIEGSFFNYELLDAGNYWQVTDKNGIKYFYGQTAAARTGPDINRFSGTFKWMLDKIEDTNNNAIEILYDSPTPEETYIKKIAYNPVTPGGNYYTSINFILQDQPLGDKTITDYRGGFKSKVFYLLDRIETKIKQETLLVKRYRLSYADNLTRSLLTEVAMYDSDDTPFPGKIVLDYTVHDKQFDSELTNWETPQEINYYVTEEYQGENLIYVCNTSYNTPNVQRSLGNHIDVLQIDMNGDGLPDRVEKPPTPPLYDCSPSYPSNQYLVYLNTREGFNSQSPTWTIPGLYPQHPVYYGAYGDSTGVVGMFKDMNGDGKPDRVEFDYYDPYTHLNVYLNTGAGFNPQPQSWVVGFNGGHAVFPQNQISSGSNTYVLADLIDINGDGLPDRVSFDPANLRTKMKVMLNNGSNFESPMDWEITEDEPWLDLYIRISDQNGTYSDLIDMNGDGLPDRVVWYSSVPTDDWLYVYFNNGHGFDNSEAWYSPKPNPTWKNYIRAATQPYGDGVYLDMIDMNGDGLVDRVTFNPSDYYNSLLVYLNSGSGFFWSATSWPTPYVSWTQYVENKNAYYNTVVQAIMDIDGDGLPDRVTNWSPFPGAGSLRVYKGKGERPYLLKSITNGLGATTTVAYTPSTKFDHSGGDGIPDLPLVLPLVTSLTVNDGRELPNTGTYETTYEYQDGYFFTGTSSIGGAYEREFRGFREVWAKNTSTGTETYTLFDQAFSEERFKGRVIFQKVTTPAGEFRTVENDWVIEEFSIDFPALRSVLSTLCDFSNPPYTNCYSSAYEYKTKVETWFNENGDPIRIYNHNQWGSYPENTADDVISAITYKILGGNILNKPETITIFDYLEQQVSKKVLDYNGFGNLLSEISERNINDIPDGYSPGNPEVNYDYDGPYNNLHTVSDPRDSTYLTTFGYTIPEGDETTDIADLFPTSVINALGHETKKSYDPGTGNVMSITDPNGSITRYEYDSFGRLTEVWSDDWTNGSLYLYSYDSMGHLEQEEFYPWWESGSYTKKYKYNTLGQVTSVTFPDNSC